MLSDKRRHTIIAGTAFLGQICGSLEKDWFDYRWCEACLLHYRITRANHEFHVVSDNAGFTIEQAAALADAALAGKTRIVDLREYSTRKLS